jgi:L-ascorbate metabolism protein UlaG (beta-lactamase superfamily)
MRSYFAIAYIAAIAAIGLPPAVSAAAAPVPSNRRVDIVHTAGGDLSIMPIYHGSVMLQYHGMVIDIDPWSRGDYTGLPPADLIVITHTHADHLDRSMVDRLHKPDTIIVGPPAVIDTLNCAPMCGHAETIGVSDRKTVLGIGIRGVPMYNIVYGSAPGEPFHHRGVGSGFVFNFAGTRLYISGDTECTPEMKALRNITVAFLSMSPPRTMSPKDAATCALAFKPKIVYPYHYRGSKPQDFADALSGSGIEVRIRQLEGEAAH